MKKIMLLIAALVLIGCSAKDTDRQDGVRLNRVAYKIENTTYKLDEAEDMEEYEKPSLDSVVKWVDVNGNIHIDVCASDFPVPGDSGVFFTIVVN